MKALFAIFLILTTYTVKASTPVKGIADLHLHAFFQLSFGGTIYAGSIEQSRSEIYPTCNKENMSSFWRRLAFKYAPVSAGILLKKPCIKSDKIHPNWETIGNQQVWTDSLKQAHEKGLSLVVISMVNSRILCEVMTAQRRRFQACDDTSNITRQIQAFHKLDEKHEWIELAKSPEEARAIINAGKMAAILSIEASDLFDAKNWKKQADQYYQQGVRTFQIVHMFNNRFSGAALYRKSVQIGQRLNSYKKMGEYKQFEFHVEREKTPYRSMRVKKNKMGLTKEGRKLVSYMADKGYMIDLAHTSEKALKSAAQILLQKNYPFYISHGHPREIIKSQMGKFEKSTNHNTFTLIKRAGGIFGLRTFYEKAYTYEKSGVKNNCHGSSKSLAQAISYIEKEHGVPVILATDLNGFIQQTKPRFNHKKKRYCRFEDHKTKQGNDYDTTGLGHIAQLPDLVKDLKLVGADVSQIEKSSENFIQFWERSKAVKP